MERIQKLLKNNPKLRRFIIVGIVVTSLDFGLLFALKSAGLETLAANIISTTTAFLISFTANKHYTFQSRGGDVRREIISFTVVTLVGLWGLQSLVIAVSEPSLLVVFSDSVATFIAKVIATAASTIWNYLFYSRVVFTQPAKGEDT